MKLKIQGIIKQSSVDGEGIRYVIFCQGCPHHCKGCHNPETWNFDGGVATPSDIRGQIIKAISANGIERNFSVLGGEPLCEENVAEVDNIITGVRSAYPDIKIYVWTGYYLSELLAQENPHIENILNHIDVLIDGRYVENERDITLDLRGSRNQRILKKNIDF